MPLNWQSFGGQVPIAGSNAQYAQARNLHPDRVLPGGGPVTGGARVAPMSPTGFVGVTDQGAAKSTDTLTGPQHQVLNTLSNTLLWQLGQENPMYEGPGIPGATGSQQQAFQGANALGTQGVETRPAIEQMVSGQADPNEVLDYYQRAVVNPSQAQWRQTQRQLGERYGDTYGTSGGFLRGLGQAANDYNTNLSGQLAQLQFGERQAARDRQGQGIQLAAGQEQQRANTLRNMLDLGGQERAIEAQMNQGDLAAWEAQQGYNNPWLQVLGGPVLGTQGTTYRPEGPSTLSQVMQGIGGVGQLIGGIASAVA